MTARRFGVEIEHSQPKFRCDTTCSVKIGQHIHCQEQATRAELETRFPRWGTVTADGSGVEVRSPILCGDRDLKTLEDVLAFLRDDLGGTVTSDDGLHVHHDAPEYTVDDDELAQKRVITLLQSWCNNQAIINELVTEHRRADWYKCSMAGYSPTNCYTQVTQKTVDEAKELFTSCEHDAKLHGHRKPKAKAIIGSYDRFHALNVRAISLTGTIELRQYQGTLNFDRVRSWIRFGQCFIDTALQDDDVPIAPYDSIDTLMRDMGMDSFERGILKEVGV